MKSVLSIDLGASSGRVMLVSVENQLIETHEIHRFSDYSIEEDNHLKWNIQKIMNEIYKAIKIASKISDFASIAVDTWGVDFGLLDKNGELLENPYHYRDKRTDGYLTKIKGKIEENELYIKTGIQEMEINTLFQICALKEQHPEVYEKAEHMLLMPDLINYFLTSKIKSERTIASTTQLYNPSIRDWDYKLIEKLGLKQTLFSEIVDTGTIVGELKKTICSQLDILPIPVIATASHDTASAILCTPFCEKENLFLSSGTWSLIGTQLTEPIVSNLTYKNNLSNETGADNKITLLKNITGLWLIQETKRQFEKEGRKYSFTEIANLAADSKSLSCYFDTELPILTVPGNIPKQIKKIARMSHQEIPESDGEVFRVIYENLALKYRSAMEGLQLSVDNEFKQVYVVGGGANADFLSQCTADALAIEVIAGYTEATILGNSLVQMATMGIVSNLSEVKQLLKESFHPRYFKSKKTQIWQKKYMKYENALKNFVSIDFDR